MSPSIEEFLKPYSRISCKESLRIAVVSPMKILPKTVVPDPYSRLQPPVFHYGWVFELDTCRTIAALEPEFSRMRSEDDSNRSDSGDGTDDEDATYWLTLFGGERNMSEETRTCLRDSMEMQLFKDITSALMMKLGMPDLNDDFVQPVLASTPGEPEACTRLALSIGDNFHLNELPSDEVLTMIKKEFRFNCDAGWFLDALDKNWVQY